MKKSLFFCLLATIFLVGCIERGSYYYEDQTQQQIAKNVEKRFGTTFDPNHDWCTTTSGVITVNGIPSSVEKVQLLAYIADSDTTTSMTILNEIANPGNQVTISYDGALYYGILPIIVCRLFNNTGLIKQN